MVVSQQYAHGIPKRLSIEELKKKYETQMPQEASKPQSPKVTKKIKVKQLASLYNGKISQLMEKEHGNKKANNTKDSQKSSLPKPVPLPRTRFDQNQTPVPSPRSKTLAKLQKSSTFFVAEDILAKLSVKDKALLYTQFVNDMSRKNPKFVNHAERIEANLKKEVKRGEVVNEKQESVKHLLKEIEARCVFPRQTISPEAMPRVTTIQRPSRRDSFKETVTKSKEFEDLMKREESHISSLTITLQSNNDKDLQTRHRRAKSLPRHKTQEDDLNLCETVHKRNNDKMRTTLSIDVYAPPKKIRRTRAEHLAPAQLFQNQHLEQLFYTWLKERQLEVETTKEVLGQSKIDQLLEQAIAKLETVETKQKKQVQVEVEDKVVPTTQQPSSKPMISSESSTTSSAKHSAAEESESGVSNMEKHISDASPQECTESTIDDSGFVKPLKASRKKKMRRSLTWRKDSTMIESNILISSTDSEADHQLAQRKPSSKLANSDSPSFNEDSQFVEPSFEELDKTLMKSVNSPRKIKSAYTLTVCTPNSGLDSSSTSSLNTKRERHMEMNQTNMANYSTSKDSHMKKMTELPRSLVDSFDQGFETGSNDVDSPVRSNRKARPSRSKNSPTPIENQLAPESHKASRDKNQKSLANPSCFSTPIKHQAQHNLTSAFNEITTEVQTQIFSPISVPVKNRRRSIYDNESRRSSLAMQVIREDHPLEHHEIQSPSSVQNSGAFFANAPTLEFSSNLSDQTQQSSSFWIKSGDFSISLDIQKNESDRLKLLYEIFSQRSCDTKDLHFGIDGHRFAVHHNVYEEQDNAQRLPQLEGYSQYWFSSGDLAIPFSGKLMASQKVERLFQFIKASVEETGVLQFGVDNVEFSNVSQYWSQSPKFSLESNYSMLVGLQSGQSNGLEGRSKYAWPHSKPVQVSDLDQSDFESEYFEDNVSGRSSLSPFGNEQAQSSDTFGNDYQNESLDQLFQKTKNEKASKSNDSTKVPQVMNILQKQHQRLSSVKERLSSYHKSKAPAAEPLDALKGSPEYIAKLKDVVSHISRIGSDDGFKNCSLEDLERYMFFLSRYADICLNSCSGHMDKILDALLDQRAVFV
uniref:Uncharacterized protein n=1 Tax=Stomoxys calcitrans TaxID=35570 RepID=A0A1I8PA19_STOCA